MSKVQVDDVIRDDVVEISFYRHLINFKFEADPIDNHTLLFYALTYVVNNLIILFDGNR